MPELAANIECLPPLGKGAVLQLAARRLTLAGAMPAESMIRTNPKNHHQRRPLF